MKLSIQDRLNILSILPTEGDFVKMETKAEIREKIKIDTEEREAIDLKTENKDGQLSLTWDKDAAEDQEFDLNNAEMQLLKDQVHDLNKKGKINDSLLEICKTIRDYKRERKEKKKDNE